MSPYREPPPDLPSPVREEVELEVDDLAFGGWKSGEVRLGLEDLAHTFSLNYVDTQAGIVRSIQTQNVCRVLIDGQGILEGYVFGAREYEDADRYEMSVSGRSVTADLVDCTISRGAFSNAKLETIAKDLCDPFGIEVDVRATSEVAQQRFDTFAIQRGESVHEALARVARRRGLLMTTENGLLVFEQAGARSTGTILQRGVNILSREWTEDFSQRFSPIRFRGQTRATRDNYGESSAIIRNEITDPAVIRYRPQTIQQGAVEGTRDLGVAAIHQRNLAAARSERLVLTVPGWLDDEDKHWRPNTLVRVRDSRTNENEITLLVAEVGYQFDVESERGRVTELTLTRPEAFDLVDYPARRVGEGWGS